MVHEMEFVNLFSFVANYIIGRDNDEHNLCQRESIDLLCIIIILKISKSLNRTILLENNRVL